MIARTSIGLKSTTSRTRLSVFRQESILGDDYEHEHRDAEHEHEERHEERHEGKALIGLAVWERNRGGQHRPLRMPDMIIWEARN